MPQGGNRGHRSTQETRERFFHLVFAPDGPGLSIARAAETVGISRTTGDRWAHGWTAAEGAPAAARRGVRELPDPKTFDELSDDAKIALEDFGLFREMFFNRRRQVWSNIAAREIVSGVSDTQERTFIDLNVFPGAGKTFTMHDLVCWLLCGGGTLDPAFGRAMRIMLGSRVLKVAKHMVTNVRRDLERNKPYWDKDAKVYAAKTLALEYGRFKPDPGRGEESIWAADQFLVAQVGTLGLYEKEPTVQAASEDSGFLGERVNLAIWDDLAVTENARGPEQQEELSGWFEDEAEERIEPGGTLILVGQRISPYDLHRARLDAVVPESYGSDETKPLYRHIVFPAHHDALCAVPSGGEHKQWDGRETGCMTDSYRLHTRDWLNKTAKANYRTIMQQEDVDPGRVLIKPEWITGVIDDDGFPSPGCYDHDRAFGAHPEGVGGLVDYVAVDPSVSGWWAIEWWAYHPATKLNYLIWGLRKKMTAGELLDWDEPANAFTGEMERIQQASAISGHPIRCWVIEANAAHRYLFQYQHWRRWRLKWSNVAVYAHQTQRNKLDKDMGVPGLLRGRYRTGMKRLPRKSDSGPEGPKFINQFVRELTTYSLDEQAQNTGFDCVMSDWIGETNLVRIVQGSRPNAGWADDVTLPPYLARQRVERLAG